MCKICSDWQLGLLTKREVFKNLFEMTEIPEDHAEEIWLKITAQEAVKEENGKPN